MSRSLPLVCVLWPRCFKDFRWLRPLRGGGAPMVPWSPPGSTPAPLPPLPGVVPWCSPLLWWDWPSSLPSHPWGEEWSCSGVVPLGSWYPLTPHPSVAASPKTFCRHTFPLSQGEAEVWNLVSNTQLLLLCTDFSGVSEHQLHHLYLVCIGI